MISDKLFALRRRSGMSQQEVASAVGVSRQTVSNWEQGQGAPALDKAAELARLFNVSLDDLASDEVDVVSSGRARRRDTHVLRSLVGRTATVELIDEVIEGAELLDVNEDWLRVSCAVKRAGFGSPKVERERVVRLVDLADVRGLAVKGGA